DFSPTMMRKRPFLVFSTRSFNSFSPFRCVMATVPFCVRLRVDSSRNGLESVSVSPDQPEQEIPLKQVRAALSFPSRKLSPRASTKTDASRLNLPCRRSLDSFLCSHQPFLSSLFRFLFPS